MLRRVDKSQMLWEKGWRSSGVGFLYVASSKQREARKPRRGSGHSPVFTRRSVAAASQRPPSAALQTDAKSQAPWTRSLQSLQM